MQTGEKVHDGKAQDQRLRALMRAVGIVLVLTASFFLTREALNGPIATWFYVSGLGVGLLVFTASWLPAHREPAYGAARRA